MSVQEPVHCLEDVVLSCENLLLIRQILREHNRQEVLKAHGLHPSNRILLFGPPGCGKTVTAEAIASELGCPLATVRTDSMVSSYLGETAANLRKVFDFAASVPMVVLFDEFDALGKEREDSFEHGELRRAVNVILQMLDDYQGRSVIVAATNHEGMLDAAVWRRFEEVLYLKPPTPCQILQMIAIKLRGTRRKFSFEEVPIKLWFPGSTHAEVERIVLTAVKEMVLEDGSSYLRLEHLEMARRREKARKNGMSKR